ncbi:MAG TPA: hypothetical protein DCZ95_16255 [Verrucomicrobia bacterium]|nr:MAG: hypothetical protein A2X46_05985 [Lentisphaerae bacterium GWF2_57_35]HBA85636.1 hypothetical protein [Verrucomicrobiota bacterium]
MAPLSTLVHDPVLIFATVMLIMLIAPLVSTRIRLPSIIGLILAGLLAGPHALGLLQHDKIFELLGAVGLVYLMFLTGLEINLNEFIRHPKPSLIYGFAAFLLALVLGTAGGRLLLGFSWPSAILLSSLFATNTLMTFPIVSRLGLAKHQVVTAAIGGTILTDTLALLALSVMVNWMQGSLTAFFWIRQVLSLVLLVFLTLWALPRIGFRFFRLTSPDGASEFVFILAAVFLTAFGARLAGVEPIVGAFLAGVALSRLIPGHSPLMNRLQFVGQALFIPFFLISVGMRIDLKILFSGFSVWMVFIFMIGMVLLVKWSAARLSGKLLRYTRNASMLLLGLCVNQAAAPLAIVLVGHRIGLFTEAVLNGAILMVLVTNLVGGWLTEKYGRLISLQATPERPETDVENTGRTLVPVSHPDTLPGLLDLALMLRPQAASEPIYPLYVAQDGVDVDERVAFGEKLLGAATARIVAAEAPVLPLTRIAVNVAGGILHVMKEFRISMLVIGWNGRSDSLRMVFHTLFDQILEQSLQMVVVSRIEHPLNTTRRIVLILPPMTERQAGFATAINNLGRLVVQMGARLHLLYVDRSAQEAKGLKGIPATVAVTRQPLSVWNDLMPALSSTLQEGDIMVLFSARRARTAWQPSLVTLPGRISRAHPQTSLLVVYPSDFSEEKIEEAPSGALPKGLAPSRILFDLEGFEAQDAIRLLLETMFAPASPAWNALNSVLCDMPPVELAAGMALLHSHVGEVSEPTIFLGVSESGFAFEGFDQPATYLLILLSPTERPPDLHLKTLAGLARFARKPDFMQTIKEAVAGAAS